MQAEDGGTVKADQATETVVDGPVPDGSTDAPRLTAAPASDPATDSDPDPGSAPDSDPAADSDSDSKRATDPDSASAPDSDPDLVSDPNPASDPDPDPDLDADPSRPRRLPVATGIGCAALLLPLIAVAGAILCFAAGILSAATGCAPNGSALCSSDGPWLAFALPLFVSPLIAAGAAIGAVTVRRHRSTWLAVGYGVVFISVIVGLASASTGSG